MGEWNPASRESRIAIILAGSIFGNGPARVPVDMADDPSISSAPGEPGCIAGPALSDGKASIAPELAALAQNGAAISIASCSRDGDPVVGLGVGCILSPDGDVRTLLSHAANARLVEVIANGGAVAVTFTGTRDHTSFQLKASRATVSGSCPDDGPEVHRQAMLLREGLVEIGFSPDQAAGYTAFVPGELGAIVFRPERVFSQTPGPGAGKELGR